MYCLSVLRWPGVLLNLCGIGGRLETAGIVIKVQVSNIMSRDVRLLSSALYMRSVTLVPAPLQ